METGAAADLDAINTKNPFLEGIRRGDLPGSAPIPGHEN